jgi:hypothetical protein
VTLARKKFPLTTSAFINKTIQPRVPGSKNFVWTAILITLSIINMLIKNTTIEDHKYKTHYCVKINEFVGICVIGF